MELYWYVVVFVLGTIIGSFLNVVIYRLHTGKSLNGRSHCLSCGSALHWYELVPLFSYVFLRARCRSCASYISHRYFIVEIFTGILYAYLWSMFADDFVLLIVTFFIAAVLIVIMVYDIRHTIIPDELVILLLGASVLTILYSAFTDHFGIASMLWHMLSGSIVGGFLAALWFFSGGRWMGLGDGKLAFALFILLAPLEAFSAIALAFWVGAGVSLLFMGLQHFGRKGKTRLPYLRTPLRMKSEIPFAPFLIVGFTLVYLFHINVFDFTHVFVL